MIWRSWNRRQSTPMMVDYLPLCGPEKGNLAGKHGSRHADRWWVVSPWIDAGPEGVYLDRVAVERSAFAWSPRPSAPRMQREEEIRSRSRKNKNGAVASAVLVHQTRRSRPL